MAADIRALSWKCHACNMVFTNPSLLQKHRARFCVGKWDADYPVLSSRRREDTPPKPPPEDTNHTPRYNPNHDPKVQQLAEVHGRQMEFLQSKNRDLERQREEIRRRLEELGRRPQEKDNSTEELLRELREQEARNQRLLNELRLQLAEARRPVNVQQPAEPGKKTFIYPVYYGNSLVAEIIAVRQAYLQNGGNDPEMLAQLAQMQAEAQAIDDSLKNAQKRQPRDKKDGTSQLLTLEMENERLQRQLLLLQEQKIISSNRRKDNREGRTPDPAPRPASPRKPPPTHQHPPRKPPPVPKSVTKWVQTNPVPSDQADTSALVPEDYPTKRQNAKLALEDCWGPVQPTPRGGPQPLKSSSRAQTQPRRRPRGFWRTDDPELEQPETLESLQPGRLDTIQEAANVDGYNPEEPLDVNLTSLPRKKKRAFFPYKPDMSPRPNSGRLVIVRSERPYRWVDFYGRRVDEKGRLLEIYSRERNEQVLRESLFPYNRRSMTDPRLLTYELFLNSMYGRPSDLRYDPYYSSLYKRKMYTAEPLDIDRKSIQLPRQSTYPLMIQDKAHGSNNSQEPQQVPETANAEAQTDPSDAHRDQEEDLEAYPTLRRRRPPPSVQTDPRQLPENPEEENPQEEDLEAYPTLRRRRPPPSTQTDPRLLPGNPEEENPQAYPGMGRKRPPPPTKRPTDLGPQTAQT